MTDGLMGHTTYARVLPPRMPNGQFRRLAPGEAIYDVALSRLHNRGASRTHAALRLHPYFTFPELPRTREQIALVDFILESVARFVSPPKIEGENEEFACEDIAEAIRTKLKPEILSMLSKKRRPPGITT